MSFHFPVSKQSEDFGRFTSIAFHRNQLFEPLWASFDFYEIISGAVNQENQRVCDGKVEGHTEFIHILNPKWCNAALQNPIHISNGNSVIRHRNALIFCTFQTILHFPFIQSTATTMDDERIW